MQSHITRFVGAVAFIMLSCVATERAAQAQPACSNATLHGSYGFRVTGRDFAAVARFTFDGKRGLTGKLLGRVPGMNIGPLEFTGTYSVSPDCVVTDSWLGGTHVSVIVDQGEGYFILNVGEGPDGVNRGEARKQFAKNEDCGLTDPYTGRNLLSFIFPSVKPPFVRIRPEWVKIRGGTDTRLA